MKGQISFKQQMHENRMKKESRRAEKKKLREAEEK